jgi:hypothetical protein
MLVTQSFTQIRRICDAGALTQIVLARLVCLWTYWYTEHLVWGSEAQSGYLVCLSRDAALWAYLTTSNASLPRQLREHNLNLSATPKNAFEMYVNIIIQANWRPS